MSLFPRPGYKRAYLAYKLGTPYPRGYPVLSIHFIFYRRPRRRSRHRQSRGTLHYLAVRRYMAACCWRRGYQRIKPGLWYDHVSDVVYLQTYEIEPLPCITRGK